MTDPLLASYEEIPYESTPRRETHPDILTTTGILLGMKPAPLEHCRVLELGCSTGGNLLPLAMSLPESTFVGIDLSPGHIAAGQKMVDALSVRNLTLRALSILDFDDSFGRFDYIICHGVYSWVPDAVQKKILSICHDNLSPQGVAFISYNTYPGWHIRGMIREMLAFHVAQFDGRQKKIDQARAFMQMLADTFKGGDNPYGKMLEEEAELLELQDDSYIYHEHLEEENHPLYFHQFAQRCAEAGLQYMAEARPSVTSSGVLPPALQEKLNHLGLDLIRREQYLDFMRNRTFRRSILCRSEVKLNRVPEAALLEGFHLSILCRPANVDSDGASDESEEFNAPEGPRVTTNNPIVKSALHILHDAFPLRIFFPELVRQVQQRVPRGDVSALAPAMLQCYLASLVDFHAGRSLFVTEVSEKPQVFPLARYQAIHKKPRLSTLRHDSREIDGWDRVIVGLLDGTRSRDAILAEMMQQARSGRIAPPRREGAQGTPDSQQIEAAVDDSLQRIARAGLLMA